MVFIRNKEDTCHKYEARVKGMNWGSKIGSYVKREEDFPYAYGKIGQGHCTETQTDHFRTSNTRINHELFLKGTKKKEQYESTWSKKIIKYFTGNSCYSDLLQNLIHIKKTRKE